MAKGTKGYTNNPGGRPKSGETLSDCLRNYLNQGHNKQDLAKKIFDMAMKGNVHAMREIFNRLEGLPKSTVDLNHAGEVGVVINIPKELLPQMKKDNE